MMKKVLTGISQLLAVMDCHCRVGDCFRAGTKMD